jgi:thiol-disulfide isomerase/thioredoxin
VAHHRAVRRLGGAAAAASLVFWLAGCSGAEPAAEAAQGFVSGSGTVSVIDAAQRKPAPVADGETLTGEPLSFADFAGRVVVVNVWGSWCPPCRAEAPDLVAAARRLAPDDVAFVGINVRDTRANAQAFVEGANIPYPSLFDQSGSTLLGFRDSLPPNAIPSTLVIDARGNVAARVLGPVDESTLVGLVRDVLAGP